MKKLLTIFFVFLISIHSSQTINTDKKYLISAIYKNQNLFIKNNIDKEGVGYAIKSIRLNGELLTCFINKEIIEIDFEKYGIEAGEKIEIIIKYDSDSYPEFLYMNIKNELDNFIQEKWLVKNE